MGSRNYFWLFIGHVLHIRRALQTSYMFHISMIADHKPIDIVFRL